MTEQSQGTEAATPEPDVTLEADVSPAPDMTLEPELSLQPEPALEVERSSPEAEPTPEPETTPETESTPEPQPTPGPKLEPGPEPGPASEPVPHAPVPSPRDVAAVVASHEPAIDHAAEARMAEAAAFGRVDEDGTVYVRTPSGDVAVGQYQAGQPQEALAYFARRYDAYAVEVELLEQRLAAGSDVAIDDSRAALTRIREALDSPQVVGDLEGLRARIDAVLPQLDERRAAEEARRAAAREAARAERERIVAAAEALVDSTAWKATGEQLKSLLEEWKTAPRIDRSTEQTLWKRFSAARNAFDRRRRAHFAKLGTQQAEAKQAKERLVREAEELATSTDWAATANEMRRLMDEWKAAGRAGRAADDALWTRFRGAQDAFYEARSKTFAARDAEQTENLQAKEALVTEAERLLPLGDLASAKAAMRDIQERWEAVGHVPRGDRERVEGRLRRVEQAIRDAEQSRWRRSNPEARARAQDTVDQLTTAITRLEKQLATAEAAGDARKAREAQESLTARREWLVQAEMALEEFSER